jgi:osmotically-inducible protein OsmY
MACVAAILAGGVSPVHAGVSDAWISTKVKMLLINSPEVGGLPINVDTDEGRVTLHGKVSTGAEKVEAERIALAGTGVVSVRNLLQVVSDSRRKKVDVADDRLKEDVNAAFKDEPALKNSSIRVKSVNKGLVLIEGKAATLSDHLFALEVTSGVPGVLRVASEVESPDAFGDREIWNDDTPANPSGGNAVTDGWITAQTKMRFMTDAEIPSTDIHVDTRRGVVTLFGTAPTEAVSDKAARVAKEVSGVRSVNRELRIVAAPKLEKATAKDDEIESAVRKRIGEAKLEGANVHAAVKAAVARVTGTVRSGSDRYAVVAITRATPGVAWVQNDLRIESTQTSQK